MHRRRLIAAMLLLSVIAWLLLTAFTWLFQPTDPTSLSEVVAWLALGPGAVWLAGKAVSFLLEEIPGWGTAISGRLRALIVLLLACAIAVGAYFLQLRADMLTQLDPWYKLAFLIVTTWASTQVTFAGMRKDGLVTR